MQGPGAVFIQRPLDWCGFCIPCSTAAQGSSWKAGPDQMLVHVAPRLSSCLETCLAAHPRTDNAALSLHIITFHVPVCEVIVLCNHAL